MSRLLQALVIGIALCGSAVGHAQPQPSFVAEVHSEVNMEVGETKLVKLSTRIVRVSVADPTVADVQVVTPQQVLITAKAVGFTHLIVWGPDEQPLVMAVSATRNLDQLRGQFTKLFPESPISVSAAGDLIVLSGSVADVRLPARAAEVAKLHSEKVANLIQVTGDQQVQLDVRFAEVSRSGLRSLGLNMLYSDPSRGYVGGAVPPSAAPGSYLHTDTLQIPGTGGSPLPPVVGAPAFSNAFNWMFSANLAKFPFSAILSMMSQEGIARVLAEPTLVALSGQQADFHSGGEVPIVMARALGNVSVTFKKFGVLLHYTPTVLSERTMSLKMKLEVSEPDPSVGVTLGGYSVPGFRTRSSETTVRLRDGQSFAISGLLSDSSRNVISKTPWLGDIPVLGTLFRSTSYQRNETELLMVVTAHLVKPLQPGEVPILPGEDQTNDPSDFDLFVLGRIEPTQRESYKHGRPAAEDPSAQPKAQGNALRPPQTPAVPGTAQPAGAAPVGPIGFIRN